MTPCQEMRGSIIYDSGSHGFVNVDGNFANLDTKFYEIGLGFP